LLRAPSSEAIRSHYEQGGLSEVMGDWRVQGLVKEAVAQGPGGGMSGEADEKRATALLSRFLFPPSRWQQRVAQLSGGERRRLQMLQVLARQPNFLCLDEPTNDLDLDTIQVLEEFLVEEFSGVLLVVSHDRFFLDKVVDHLFVLPGDGIGEVLDWQASFTDYLLYQEHEERLAKDAPLPLPPPPPAAPDIASSSSKVDNAPAPPPEVADKPLSNFERKQLERLEGEMEALAEQQAGLQAKVDGFDATCSGYTELQEWTEQIESLGAELEDVETKWLVLADRAEL